MKKSSNINAGAKLNDEQSAEVLREWGESAQFWQKHFDTIRTMFSPVSRALINEAGLVEGERVLDVAGGSGEPSLTIAATVGPTGSVMCTDAVPEMVSAARSAAQRHGLTNISFRQCTADSLPFESDSFDAVVCRLGAMLFPDPKAALLEMLRVIKPAGVIALVVWGKSELNPFVGVVADILERHLGAAAPVDPNAPGAFRFAEPDSLARILRAAGCVEVKERPLEFDIATPISPAEYWELRSETSGTLRERLASLIESQRQLIAVEVQHAVRQYFPNDQMSFPARMIIVSGKKR